jgi:hypothetical protein
MNAPYKDKPVSEWRMITETLLSKHPLPFETLIQIVLKGWSCILESKICGLQIGTDLFPNPQMMGYFIETLIALQLEKQFPTLWKHGNQKQEKDVVCLEDDYFSFEIKSSSSKNKIFANRSYAQEQTSASTKNKNGFYLIINFDKFNVLDSLYPPDITLIRIGYIEHSDWRGQKSEKGQQASLSPEVYQNKFITLYEKTKLK